MDRIFNILLSDTGAVGLTCAIFFAIIWGLMKTSAFIAVWKDRDFSFKKIQDAIFSMQANIEGLFKKFDTLEQDQKRLNAFISQQADAVSIRKSPISLNEKGEEVSKQVEAEKIIEKHYKDLLEKINSDDPKNAYDIQQSAFTHARNILEELLDETVINDVKDIAFNQGLTMFDISKIFGILLRDKVLKERNIGLNDIDKDDRNGT